MTDALMDTSALPEWCRGVVLPGYVNVDGVLSYCPLREGEYMTGEEWPDVDERSPVPATEPMTLAEFGPELSSLPAGAIVLSVCDGGGHPSCTLAKHYPRINFIALDLSLDALRFYAPKMAGYFRTNPQQILRVHASATQLPLVSGSIDAIVGVSAIHHIQLLHTFFAEIERVSKEKSWFHFAAEPVRTWGEPSDTHESDITRTRSQYRVAFESAGWVGEVGMGEGDLLAHSKLLKSPVSILRPFSRWIPDIRSLVGKAGITSVYGRKTPRST